MADLIIPLHEIETDGKAYAFTLDGAWVESHLGDCGVQADPKAGPGSANLHAQRNGDDVLVHGRVEASLVTECVRCLGEARFVVSSELGTLFSPESSSPGAAAVDPDDEEIDPDEPDRDFYTGDKLELDNLVREYLALEIPIDPLCDEDCPGIDIPEHLKAPADLGATDSEGRDIDPRLAPLMKLASGGPDKE